MLFWSRGLKTVTPHTGAGLLLLHQVRRESWLPNPMTTNPVRETSPLMRDRPLHS